MGYHLILVFLTVSVLLQHHDEMQIANQSAKKTCKILRQAMARPYVPVAPYDVPIFFF